MLFALNVNHRGRDLVGKWKFKDMDEQVKSNSTSPSSSVLLQRILCTPKSETLSMEILCTSIRLLNIKDSKLEKTSRRTCKAGDISTVHSAEFGVDVLIVLLKWIF